MGGREEREAEGRERAGNNKQCESGRRRDLVKVILPISVVQAPGSAPLVQILTNISWILSWSMVNISTKFNVILLINQPTNQQTENITNSLHLHVSIKTDQEVKASVAREVTALDLMTKTRTRRTKHRLHALILI